MNNITAQDLMVGDWVQHASDNYFKVTRIDMWGDGSTHFACGHPHLWDYNNKFSPIPLTAEILEKNGFKNPTLNDPELINYVFKASFEHKSPLPNVEVLRVNYYDGVEWDFYALLGERESSDCGEQYEYIIIIKYVHELQHALRLAGIDITIEL